MAGLKLLPESKDPNPGPIDPLSIVLVLAAMTSLVWSIKSVAVHGFTTTVTATVLLALVAGTWFVRRQLNRATPMLDVRLFANPVFSVSLVHNERHDIQRSSTDIDQCVQTTLTLSRLNIAGNLSDELR